MTAATLDPHLSPHQSWRRDVQVMTLVGVAHALSHFFHLVLPSLFPWLKDAFSLSYAQLGLLISVFFVVSGAGQALAGFVVDRTGAWVVLLGGVVLLLVSALGFAASPDYAWLLLFSAVAGLGNSVFHPADFTILNRRVSAGRLGHAFSTHGILGNLGWAASPVFVAGLATLLGWRWALVGCALVAFGVIVMLVATRKRLDTLETHPVGGASRSAGSALSFLGLPALWICFAFFFITAGALGGIQTFAATAMHELYGVPFAYATACITAYMLASGGGMVAGGFLAGRTSHHDRVIAGAFAGVGALCVLIATGSVPAVGLIAMLALVGFGSGIAGPSRDMLVRAAAPRGATGRVYGVVYSGLDVGMSLFPLLFGTLMDAHHPGGIFVAIGLLQTLALFTALGLGNSTQRARPQPA
jgi:FSR family fosmidomycin resistance protein-like MFS transporter